MPAIAAPHLEDAWVPVDHDRAPVRTVYDRFDTRNRMGSKVGEQRVPVETSFERQPQRKPPVGNEPISRPSPCTERARRSAEDVRTTSVELADAAVTSRKRDLEDREVGVVEEPPREVRTGRTREAVGRDAEMAREEPAEVPGRHAEARGNHLLRPVVECAVEDHLNGPADELRPAPEGKIGHAVWPATQARSVARSLGRCSEPEPHDVLRIRTRAASRPTVDPSRDNRGEGLHNTKL